MGAAMTTQKDTRKAMLGAGLARANLPVRDEQNNASITPNERVMSGAVGAVSRSLDQFQSEMKAVHELVASGNKVIELDTELIEDSILKDRLEIDEVGQTKLIGSIRQNGQQVPILVRQNQVSPARYQVAYGHRRLAACRALGLKVFAIVRSLTDKELLIAQGQENSARRDLSYIERATFAWRLEQRGLDRDAIMAALSTDKTELSKLISVARAVPVHVVEAIGPASKAGRPRWLGLVERLAAQKSEKKLLAVLGDADFPKATSDERFNLVFETLRAKPKRGGLGEAWSADGKEIVRITRSDRVLTLAIDQKQVPNFGQFVLERLPSLYEAFRAKDPGK